MYFLLVLDQSTENTFSRCKHDKHTCPRFPSAGDALLQQFHTQYTSVLFVVPANKLANANFSRTVNELRNSGILVSTLDVNHFTELQNMSPEAFNLVFIKPHPLFRSKNIYAQQWLCVLAGKYHVSDPLALQLKTMNRWWFGRSIYAETTL